MDSTYDQKYFNAFINKDEKLLQNIYDDFYKTIEFYIVRNSGTKMEAKDIFQEAMVAMYQLAKKPSLRKDNFKSLFWTICKRKWLNELKLKNRQHESVTKEDEDVFIDEFNILNNIEKKEQLLLFWNHFKNLEEKCIAMFKYIFEDLSMKEVAVKMNYTYDFARTKKGRCMKSLLKAVKKDQALSEFIK